MRNLTAAADDTGSNPRTDRHSFTNDMNCAVAASSDGESPNAEADDIPAEYGIPSSVLCSFHLLVHNSALGSIHSSKSGFFGMGQRYVLQFP